MPDFAYTARDSSGQAVTGTVAADSMAAALVRIRAEGRFPVAVRPVEQAQSESLEESLPRANVRASRAEIIQFSQQLSTMIETGVTLAEALDCIATQAAKPKLKALVSDISDAVQGGMSLSEALQRHPRSFSVLYLSLIKASEKTGQMSKMLSRATTYLRDEQDIRRRVTGAMIYPSIMFAFVIATTIFLLSFVLPRFTTIYKTKNAALPLPTKFVMTLSDGLVNHWMAIVTGVAAIVVGTIFAMRSEGGARVWHYIQINTPLVGAVYKRLQLARSLRVVGTMAGAGVTLMDCVAVACDICRNSYFRDLWKKIADQIQAGRQLSDPLFNSPLVPRSVAQMIYSGEKGGKLGFVMEQVSGFAEAELKEQITALTRYIEPAMIMLMGVIIGTICLALLLPIFTISKVIGS